MFSAYANNDPSGYVHYGGEKPINEGCASILLSEGDQMGGFVGHRLCRESGLNSDCVRRRSRRRARMNAFHARWSTLGQITFGIA